MSLRMKAFKRPPSRFLVIGYGQSNMVNFFSSGNNAPAAVSGTSYYDGSSLTSVPDANGIREFLNALKTTTGVDCVALHGAVNGSPIEAFVKGGETGFYEALLANVLEVKQLGDTVLMLWDQGEGNADPDPTAEENMYKANLESIRANMSADLGVTMPLFVGALGAAWGLDIGNESHGNTDGSWHRIQQAHFNAALDYPHIHYSHSNIVTPHASGDGYHYSPEGQGYQGRLFAQSVNAYLGYATGAAHWEIASAATVDGTTTDVTLRHVLGNDFTPTSGITGFSLSGDNGRTWISATGTRTSANGIRLTHSSIATSNLRLLRYQYGFGWDQVNAQVEPDQSNTVRDNSALTVPLTPTTWNLRPTALSTLPVPSDRYRTIILGASTSISVDLLPLGPEPVRKMVILGLIGGIADGFTGGLVTPNIGAAVPVTLVKKQGLIAIYQALLGADAATARTFRFDATPNSDLGGGYSRQSLTVDTVPYADLTSTTPTGTGGASTAAGSVATATVNTSAGGFLIALAHSTLYTDAGVLSGDETITQRLNRSSPYTTQKGDASNVAARSASSVTVTYAGTGDIDLVLAAWR